ncbi:hypothetical protein TorRG33x02_220670 [Trema orientale]|uniref:Rapid ALkalinization Factor n=1 Tax=Trema orientale TaxID=63057 RepID=A0A2P5E947_TREOI|nr:hypothetical protein TorRG33x02_220670 [Trema orientale]
MKRECTAVSYAILVLLLTYSVLLLSSANPHKIEAVSEWQQCNATIGECNGEEGELTLMKQNRLLAADENKYISFDVTQKRGPVCNALIYQSCILPSNVQTRPCTIYNFCDRGRQGS